jgi:tetratricopeptide (TPR) repeat protein
MDGVNLIAALQMLNRGDEALALITRQLERTTAPPIRALLYLNQGNIHFERRAFAAAESSYQAALALDPGSRPALANLASAFAQSGRYAAAESLYERVLIVDPDDQETRVNLLQARVGRLIEEADAYRAAHRAESGAEAYRAALATVRELQQIDPGNPVIGILLRRIEQANRRPSR